jgi:hypothetical protein
MIGVISVIFLLRISGSYAMVCFGALGTSKKYNTVSRWYVGGSNLSVLREDSIREQ